MRRGLLAAVGCVIAVVVPAAPASARPYVADCGVTGYLKLKPNRWSNGCTGGSLNLRGLRWTWYGETTASAKGRTLLRVGCGEHVSCPGKGPYRATARVRMTQPRTCTAGTAKGSRFFSKVRVRVHYGKRNPFGYRAGWRTSRFTITAYEGECSYAP